MSDRDRVGHGVLARTGSRMRSKKHKPRVVAVCQGDTSTTMLQPLEEIGADLPPPRRDPLRRLHRLARRQPVRDRRLADRHRFEPACRSACPVRPASRRSPSTTACVEILKHRKHVEQGIKAPGIVEGNGPIIRSNYFDLGDADGLLVAAPAQSSHRGGEHALCRPRVRPRGAGGRTRGRHRAASADVAGACAPASRRWASSCSAMRRIGWRT